MNLSLTITGGSGYGYSYRAKRCEMVGWLDEVFVNLVSLSGSNFKDRAQPLKFNGEAI